MTKRIIPLIIFLTSIIIVPYGIQYLKTAKIKEFKESHYLNIINQTEVTLKTLIKEKQNTTAMIAMGLSKNPTLLNNLKNPKKQFKYLKNYSLELRKKTTFKNVWFQLISKDGYTIQRSWTDYKGDKIADARKDIQVMLKNPKLSNTISVGKFDMTFKTMTPIYDKNKQFMGIIEVITHFNSIAKKLEQNNIRSIMFADKSYKKQITKPFSKKFLEDYYIANKNVAPSLLTYLKNFNIEQYIKKVSTKNYIVDENLHSLVSYFKLNNINKQPMGHFLFFHPLNSINTSKITEINYFYNIVLILSLVVLTALFYFNFQSNQKYINAKLLLLTILVFIVLSIIIYNVIKQKYDQDIAQYKQNVITQTILEHDSILNNNKAIAELIFTREINVTYIKQLLKNRKREVLYNFLKSSYNELQSKYNVRQLHFHLPDSTSFLRMHRPQKFGDSLKEIRQSVDFVNKEKVPFVGFEEGRIYNGFRHVFPLELEGLHIGSVEISFDIYSFIDNYLDSFNIKRVNFLVNKDIIGEKVFKSEQSNYLKSPIKGFYFDKIVIDKLAKANKAIVIKEKNSKTLDQISNNISKGQPFTAHFKEINELEIVLPLINQLNEKIIGSINVSKDATFIQHRNNEFHQLIITIIVVLAFIMVFIYREMLTRNKLNHELQKNQIILDSQSSFILITNGINIKASNKSMLEFFGYKTLEEFKKDHECICDYFEGGDEYVQKEMGELNWFEYIYQNPKQNHLVQMRDKNKQLYIFYIELNTKNKIDNNDYIISFIDITNFKNMEQQLIHSEKMASLGNMIGNIAHQWRQPLSVISTAASGIEIQKTFGNLHDEDLNKFVKIILTNVQFLSETIDTFRDFLKEDKTISEQVIQKVLDDTLTILNSALYNHHITLINHIKYEPSINKVMSKGELAQVITNIINNAKDVLLQNKINDPKITIACKINKHNKAIISIEDNGNGVPDNIIDKIFEPYFTTKHQSMGTGLGLYMSHKIVTDSLHGNLSVHNTKNGAKFVIEIPLDK